MADDAPSKASDPSAARRGQLREVAALLAKVAAPDDRLLADAKAELAILNQQSPPAVRLFSFRRRSTALQRRADKLLRDAQDSRDGIVALHAKVQTVEAELAEVRNRQRALEVEARGSTAG